MYPELKLYIDGKFIRGEDRSRIPVLNPAKNEEIGSLPCATVQDLELAVASASRAFSMWKKTTVLERSAVLRKVADLIRSRAPAIGQILTMEQGKPLAESVGEVGICAEHAEWHAEECRRVYGRIIPARNPRVRQSVVKEPIGVCVAFSPWNFPFSQAFRKVVAAIGAGCPVILKGSSDTPASVLAIAELFHDAGLPPGVLNLVSGDSGKISEYLISAPEVRKISFTGSTPVGQRLAALAGMHMKRCTMELGGHAPVIIADDANVEAAAETLGAFKYRNAGQVCISPSRFFVHAKVYDDFVECLRLKAMSIKVGDGLDEGTKMGPLTQSRRINVMNDFVNDAVARGAQVVAGGSRLDGVGYYYKPTVIANLPVDSKFMTEEPFGPIAGIVKYHSLDEAIKIANSLPFGLAAYAYTTSVESAHRIATEIESGMLSINHMGLALAETPFGGIKESGYGSEGGSETFDGYLTTKFVTQFN